MAPRADAYDRRRPTSALPPRRARCASSSAPPASACAIRISRPPIRRGARHDDARARARRTAPRRQRGGFLLEALVGILIFSFGILGLVGLQANAIRHVNDAQYRGEAIQIANAAMGRMWTMDRANLKVHYEGDAGAGGDGYLALVEAAERLPGVTEDVALSPTVVVEDGPSGSSNLVTVTIRWRLPGETIPHQYVGVVMVGLN